jgi:flagellar hook-associated protein 2
MPTITPPITSLGIGSGLDVNSMLNQLVALERKPIELMKSEASRLQTRISSFGRVQSLVANLQDAAQALGAGSLWNRNKAVSADESRLGVVANSSAAAGSYAVTVQQLAAAQTVSSVTAFSSPTALVGAGSLRLELGAWNADSSAFGPQAGGSAIAIEITASDTLQSLRDKVNAAGAGVTASVVSDSSGARLALRSAATGEANGFRISATDADGNNTDAAGLSRLAYDPPSGANGLQLNQAAANARATVNGVSVVSPSNELTTAVDGLSLRLRALLAAPMVVEVAADREAVLAAIKKLADAYNAINSHIAEQTRYDASSRVGGVLQGDSAVSAVLARLRALVNSPSGASAAFSRLSDVGLQQQRDGSLQLNATQWEAASTQWQPLQRAFTNPGTAAATATTSGTGSTGSTDVPDAGWAQRFKALTSDLLGQSGTVTTRAKGLQKLLTYNASKQQRAEERVSQVQARLTQQFTAMDSRLSRLNALGSYVSTQLGSINNNTNNSGSR